MYWRVRYRISRAFFSPTVRGSSWQPHHSGADPIFGPAWPNLPLAPEMVRSHSTFSSLPPPMQ